MHFDAMLDLNRGPGGWTSHCSQSIRPSRGIRAGCVLGPVKILGRIQWMSAPKEAATMRMDQGQKGKFREDIGVSIL